MSEESSLGLKNKQLIKDMYEAATAMRVDEFQAYLDDKVIAEEPSFLPYGGRYEGKEKVLELLAEIATHLDNSSFTIDSLVADGANVMVLIRIKTLKDRSELQIAEHFVVENDKVTSIKIYIHELGSLVGFK
jgi:predicted SnoaL-like aldol condensation-catalyzing enzyme